MFKLKRMAAVALLVTTSFASLAAGETPTASAWDQFKAFTHQQKNEAVAEGKKLIAATDKQIAVLSKEIKNSTGEAKVAHEKNMLELKAKKKEAQAQLNKMGKSSSDAWEATKEGFSNAGKDLHAAYEKAAAAVKK
jgi:hypothetical protein